MNPEQYGDKAALRGVPSLVWRAGQDRRLAMIRSAAGPRSRGTVLIDGCGTGAYLARMAGDARLISGLDIEWDRAREAWQRVPTVLCAVGEHLFCPNRGYPFETHGIYWRGRYHFGNIPLVNYLPRRWRDRLAPHVNVYTTRDLERLLAGLPVKIVQRTIVFGAYDNIISRWPVFGRALRDVLQFLENTPLRIFGLSHFWVVEKV